MNLLRMEDGNIFIFKMNKTKFITYGSRMRMILDSLRNALITTLSDYSFQYYIYSISVFNTQTYSFQLQNEIYSQSI